MACSPKTVKQYYGVRWHGDVPAPYRLAETLPDGSRLLTFPYVGCKGYCRGRETQKAWAVHVKDDLSSRGIKAYIIALNMTAIRAMSRKAQ